MVQQSNLTSKREDPGAEQNPGLVQVLKIVVAALGLLILAGLAAVIWRMIELASSPKSANPAPAAAPSQASTVAPPPADIALELPEGASVRSTSLAGNRLAVQYEAPTGAGILILDLESGRVVSRILLKPSARP